MLLETFLVFDDRHENMHHSSAVPISANADEALPHCQVVKGSHRLVRCAPVGRSLSGAKPRRDLPHF